MTAVDILNTKYRPVYEPATATATNHIDPSSGGGTWGKGSLQLRECRNRQKYIVIVNDDKHFHKKKNSRVRASSYKARITFTDVEKGKTYA